MSSMVGTQLPLQSKESCIDSVETPNTLVLLEDKIFELVWGVNLEIGSNYLCHHGHDKIKNALFEKAKRLNLLIECGNRKHITITKCAQTFSDN